MHIPASRTRITTAPTVEPVTLTEAKLHLRIDHSTEDDLITRLIEAARQQCEDVARRAFVTRTYTAKVDTWPGNGRWMFPHPPLLGVTSVSYTDIDGATSVFSSANYIVDTHSEPGQLVLKDNVSWPGDELAEVNGITIVYTAGYGSNAGDVPDRYRQAILLLLGHLYENREAVMVAQGYNVIELPLALNVLLTTDRGGWW